MKKHKALNTLVLSKPVTLIRVYDHFNNSIQEDEMSFKIMVLIKQVPDTQNVTGNAMKEDGTVNRAALPAIFNPDYLY